MTSRLAAVATAVAAALLVLPLAACGTGSRPVSVVSTPSDTDSYAGVLLDRPYARPGAGFTDTAGHPFDWSRTKPVTIVFFGYTHCPDECPTTMADLAAALRRVDPSVRAKVDVVFVTTDPARDTAAVIRAWLDRFDPTFIGLRADPPTTERAATQLGVALASPTEHGTQLVGFQGAEGRLVWTDPTVRDLRADIERLAR